MRLAHTLPLIALLALAAPLSAQEATTEGDTAAESTAEATGTDAGTEAGEATGTDTATSESEANDGLSLGEEVTEGPQTGDTYVRSVHDDWQVRCVKLEEDQTDPCQLYQLLRDEQGNSVAEVNLFGLGGAGNIVAGANIVTPLETLLTEQLTVRVDSATPRRYPFSFCAPIGCFARIGMTAEDVNAFRRGNQAIVSIVPVGAPDQRVNLVMSLKGFTAGFEAVNAANTAETE